ncbi:transglutaminase domain-containing protein [Ruminococcus sp. AF37-20]|uniref:transglutaminase domain-containing protein n=1 Tax=Ruminococcus sp. AF37-20 TaxID=2293178 RepID=UPI000E4888AA|nr:transglutaminase domain-containing protein [Ruminococcus sp. AF37-20]RGF44375.1 transglutaminase domain-containing protein [Ruminococcus sp. AF37-20]
MQNDPQPDNSPSDNNRSNNGAEQNNDPTPPTTTAKPAVTNPPTTTTPKPQITVPQTEPPEVVIEDTTNLQSVLNYVNSLGRSIDEYYNIGTGLSHDGSDYGKAEAVYNWILDNVSGNCQVFSVATMYACKGIGLECRYAFFSHDDWYGHMANLVNVGGAWYVFDTQGGRFFKSDKYGDITRIFDENDNTIELSVSESAY